MNRIEEQMKEYREGLKKMSVTRLAQEWEDTTERLLGKEEKPEPKVEKAGSRTIKRLTEVKKNGDWQLKGVPWSDLYAGAAISEKTRQKLYGALCKLRDYENTGLSPEEIGRMME